MCRKSGFRIAGHKYGKNFNNNKATFRKGLGSFVFLDFASLIYMEVGQKIKTRKCVMCDVYDI